MSRFFEITECTECPFFEALESECNFKCNLDGGIYYYVNVNDTDRLQIPTKCKLLTLTEVKEIKEENIHNETNFKCN